MNVLLLLLLAFPFFHVFAVLYVGFIRFLLVLFGFCCVFTVFYMGFMASSLPLSSFVLCFTWVLWLVVCLCLRLCCVLRGFYGLLFAFVLVCTVFYVGFMACCLPLSSFVLCFTWVLWLVVCLCLQVFCVSHGFYGLLFAFVFLCPEPEPPRAGQSSPE